MGRDPRTVQKYAEMEDFSPENKPKQVRKSRVMDSVKPIIDEWLKEDLKKKKKFRRTAQRIFDLLVSKHGFEGSDQSVRAYVAKRKTELLEESDHAALPHKGESRYCPGRFQRSTLQA